MKLNYCFFFSGEHKVFFIPAMVGPFLEVTLVPESDLRKATLNIFFDMMHIEEKIRGNFKQVNYETFILGFQHVCVQYTRFGY